MSEKQYTEAIVTKIIHFVAQSSLGIFSSKEEVAKALEEIPENFHKVIIASVMAARMVNQLKNLS